MTRRQYLRRIGLGVIPVAAIATAIGAGRHAWRVTSYKSVSLVIQDPPTNTPPGVLAVSAEAHVPVQPSNLVLFWFVEVRSGDLEQALGGQEYLHQAFPVPAGATANPKLSERIEMPTGVYNILVGLREQRPTLHEDGTVERHSVVVAESRRITVR
jgi:hypothetical protein